MEESINLGIYRHYKGGLYSVVGFATHHETRRKLVLYVSLTTGTLTVRPLRGASGDEDGWLDLVGASVNQERFTYVTPSLPHEDIFETAAAARGAE